MEWWNDLWLNEGFASFMEYLCVDDIFPAWQMMDQFVTSHVQRSLVSDSHSDSHPISVPVKDPKEVNSIFDAISYDKVKGHNPFFSFSLSTIPKLYTILRS